MRVIFEDDTLQPPEDGDSEILCASPDDTQTYACSYTLYPSGQINYIQVEEPCGDGVACPKDTLVGLKIQGARNPRSVKPIVNQFTISSFTQEQYAIDKGTILDSALGLEITPAEIISASLLKPDSSLDQIVTGALSTYEFSVTLNNGLSSVLGKLELTLAPEVHILDAATCVAFEEGTFVQLDCEV